MATPPKCFGCGKRHWSQQACSGEAVSISGRVEKVAGVKASEIRKVSGLMDREGIADPLEKMAVYRQVKAGLAAERAEKRRVRSALGVAARCLQCESEIEPGSRRPKKFCSAKCRKAYSRSVGD